MRSRQAGVRNCPTERPEKIQRTLVRPALTGTMIEGSVDRGATDEQRESRHVPVCKGEQANRRIKSGAEERLTRVATILPQSQVSRIFKLAIRQQDRPGCDSPEELWRHKVAVELRLSFTIDLAIDERVFWPRGSAGTEAGRL